MTDTDWIALGSIAGAVTALGTVVMAIAIVVTAVYAKGTLAAAKDDSRARTRPVMVAEFRRELLSQGTTLLVLKNLGASIAKDVSVTFDPPAPPAADVNNMTDDQMMKWIYQRFAEPVTSWAPGWTISNVIRAGHDELNPITVTLRYKGPDGTAYEDGYHLLPDHIMKETEANPSKATDAVKLEQQKVSALQALVRTLRSY
jgi:hypothetical protein